MTSAAGDEASTPAPPTGVRRAVLLAFCAVALVVIALDYWTKELALARLDGSDPERFLFGAIYFDLTFNRGAAFSFGGDFTFVFPIIAIVVLGGIIVFMRGVRSLPWAVSLGLIFGGAAGNLMDRLFRPPSVLHGRVVDFISVFGDDAKYFPIFNLADSALFCGVVLAIFLEFTGRRRDGTRVQHSGRAER